MDPKVIDRVGWFASIMGILMFTSYIDQIVKNVQGDPGSIILPIATTINGIAWVTYALIKPKKDWPVFACNSLAIVLGAITAVTAVIASIQH